MSQMLQDDLFPDLVRLLEVCARKAGYLLREHPDDKETRKAIHQAAQLLSQVKP